MTPELSGALFAVVVAVSAAIIPLTYRKVGGIHFVKLNRIGMSFWISRR